MAWVTPLAITQIYGFLIIVFHEMRFYDGYDKIGSEEQREMFQGLGYAHVTMTSRGFWISMILPLFFFILSFAYIMFLKRMQRELEQKQRVKQRTHAELDEVILDEASSVARLSATVANVHRLSGRLSRQNSAKNSLQNSAKNSRQNSAKNCWDGDGGGGDGGGGDGGGGDGGGGDGGGGDGGGGDVLAAALRVLAKGTNIAEG